MKICLIDYNFSPLFAGTETHNYSLVKYLMAKGHDVHVIILRLSGENKPKIEKSINDVNKGINLYNIYVDDYKIKLPLIWYFRYMAIIKKIEKSGKIDIFDIHKTEFALHLRKNRNLIHSLHFTTLTCPTGLGSCLYDYHKCRKTCKLTVKEILIWKLVNFFTIDKFDGFILKKKSLYDEALKFGYPKDKLEMVPYWIDYNNIHSIAIKPFTNEFQHNFVFLYPTRLDYTKGHLLLLEAFNMLLKREKNVILYLIGDGESKQQIVQFCKKNNLEKHVILTGMLPREEVFKRYSIADCLLSVQLYDNYCWTLLEEMCTGKPVIATDVGPTRDILKDDYNAILVKPDPELLCDKMELIMKNKELGLRLGNNALETIKKMHSFENIEKIEKLFTKIVKNS